MIIKEFIRGFKEGYANAKGNNGVIIGHATYCNKKLPIIYSPESLKSNDGIFASCNVLNGKYRIVVDDLFIASPTEVKEFVIQHEIGHIELLKEKIDKHILWDEVYCDKYSMKQVGFNNAINALNYIWKTGINTENVDKLIAIPTRLKELGANVDSMYIIGANGIKFYEPELRKALIELDTILKDN